MLHSVSAPPRTAPRLVPAPLPRVAPHVHPPARAVRARSVIKSFEAGLPGCSARVRALNRVDIDVPPSDVVGIVGESGSGKSTLLLALAGMLRPDSGSLLWYSDMGRVVSDLSAVEYLPAWRASHALQSLKRAVSQPPGLLLLDDVLTPLDAVTRREARVLIRELRAARVTMVIAARDRATCGALCSRVIEMRRGEPRELR